MVYHSTVPFEKMLMQFVSEEDWLQPDYASINPKIIAELPLAKTA